MPRDHAYYRRYHPITRKYVDCNNTKLDIMIESHLALLKLLPVGSPGHKHVLDVPEAVDELGHVAAANGQDRWTQNKTQRQLYGMITLITITMMSLRMIPRSLLPRPNITQGLKNAKLVIDMEYELCALRAQIWEKSLFSGMWSCYC
ncbi:hypothetical protein CMV_012181 [Castanea mollissima]|uniref:Uncharacterized protein n=1 Tax=Castanea mollissima TaxID=60419 RepID=A0A8J4VN58_9ROSI|nr:hypothetical protein CMV_012181 [Castanea mollissima]